MKRQSLFYTAPREVAVRAEILPAPASNQVLVQTICSAISPGTETLLYRGLFPEDMPADDTIAALDGRLAYPFKYGYAAVGRVLALGNRVDTKSEIKQGDLVFAFNPHETHFLSEPEALWPLPDGLSPESAIFLPNMETAVSFLMDARPIIGEKAIIFGQGVVGLLTTSLLAHYPLTDLITLDRFSLRRDWSRQLGAHLALDPGSAATQAKMTALFEETDAIGGADLVFELSGNPEALQGAVEFTGFNGRILIGSWYGQKEAKLNLGGRFHRSQMKLISSQVSHINPRWRGRWTKSRRWQVAYEQLVRHDPARLITHRFPFAEAARAYQLIARHPEKTIQVILTYDA